MRVQLGMVMVVLFTMGCATRAQHVELRRQIEDMEKKLSGLEHNQSGEARVAADRRHRLAVKDNQLEQLNLEIRKINGHIDVLRQGVETGQLPDRGEANQFSLAERLDGLEQSMLDIVEAQSRLQVRIRKLEQPAKGKSSSTQRKRVGSVTAQHATLKDLQGLKKAFESKRYKYVVASAPAILKSQKSPQKTQDTIYYLAESLYKLGNLQEAALKYSDFLEAKPTKRKPHALMRIGDCFRHLGQAATAKLYYEDLVNQFPKTAEAKRAQERLAKL